MTAKNESAKARECAIERFFNENEGIMPAPVVRLMREIMGEYANGDSVLLQKRDLREAFASILEEGTLEGPESQTTKERIIDAVEQVQAASSLSEKAVVDLLELFEEMRKMVEEVDQDQLRSDLNKKISAALELCTFEDIAAQHMGKALSLLKHTCEGTDPEKKEGDELLNGPAIDGDGMSQEDIDKLLNG